MADLNETWIAGKYTVLNHIVEINTSLPYLAIDGARIDFFSQGQDASENIALIHRHWTNNDCSVEYSIQWFIDTYLNY